LTLQGYCLEHRRSYERARGSAAARGYGRRWGKLRLRVLAEEPLCRICEAAESTEVDHIQRKQDGGTDLRSNLRGLCKACHSRRHVEEGHSLGR
jgi:5-methylcytosine-specific restriction protein A